jgi:hypothetical protein
MREQGSLFLPKLDRISDINKPDSLQLSWTRSPKIEELLLSDPRACFHND